MLEVPFTSDYDQRFVTQLGDEKYVIDSRWNERGKTRSFDLTRDSDQVKLLASAPMQIGQDILAPYALGIGALLVTDLTRKNTDAGPEDLGTRVIVTWLSPDEMAAIKAALGPAGASIVASGAVPPIVSGGGSSGSGGGSSGGGSGSGGTTVNTTVNTFNMTGGAGFGTGTEILGDSSGDQILVARFPQNPGLNPNPTISLTGGFFGTGSGTVRIYVGGILEARNSVGTPSGTLVATIAVSGAEAAYWFDQALANPGGIVPVKITIQSAAPATDLEINTLQGALG